VRSTLSSPRLRRILIAYTVNRLGSWVGLVALSLAVFDHTHSALAVTGLLFAWQALPAFLVPVVVARVEASNRRSELSALYFFEGLTTAALAVLLSHFWLPALLLLAALDGTAALAASALLRAAVARVAREEAEVSGVGEVARTEEAGVAGGSGEAPAEDPEERAQESMRRANAALNVAFSIAFVTGPAIGGAIVAGTGAPAALFLDVGSFILCGALLLDLHPHVEEAGGDSVRARLRAAWTHINTGSLRALLATEAITLIFIQAAGPIEVVYAKATLHAGDGGYGVLVSFWGAGAVLASVVFARTVRHPLGALLSGGVAAIALAFLAYGAAPSLAVACVAALVGGFGNGLDWPSLMSLVQRLAPPRLHGRVLGAAESIPSLSMLIGLPLGGALVAISSTRVAFVTIGLGTVIGAGAFLRMTLRGFGAAERAATVANRPDPT
jgi:MFS family permease